VHACIVFLFLFVLHIFFLFKRLQKFENKNVKNKLLNNEYPGEQMSVVTIVRVNKCSGGISTGSKMSAPGKNHG